AIIQTAAREIGSAAGIAGALRVVGGVARGVPGAGQGDGVLEAPVVVELALGQTDVAALPAAVEIRVAADQEIGAGGQAVEGIAQIGALEPAGGGVGRRAAR